MKVIIAGSRTLSPSVNQIAVALDDAKWIVTEVVSGLAAGVDHVGECYAKEFCIPVKGFAAKWQKYGRSAGMMRNREMAEYADAALVFWDGSSKGAKSMIDTMKRLKKPVYVVEE